MSVKKLSINSAIYFASNFLQRGFGLITMPLLTGYLSLVDYGDYVTIISMMGLISVFFTWGIENAMQRFYYDRGEYKPNLFGSCMVFVFINGSILLVLFLLLGEYLFPPIIEIDFYPLIMIMVLISYFDSINNIFIHIQYTTQKSITASVFSLIKVSLNCLMLYLFVIWFDLGVQGALLGMMSVSACFFLFSIGSIIYSHGLSFDTHLIFGMLRYCIPLIPGYYIGYLILGVDRIWLKGATGSEDVAIFDAAIKVSSIIQILAVSVNLAFKPWLFKHFEMVKSHYDQIATIIVSVYIISGLILIYFSDIIISLLTSGEAYRTALQYVPLIVCAWVIRGYDLILSTAIQQKKELVKYSSVSLAISGLVGLLVTYFLISQHTLIGASVSKIVVFLLITFGYWLVLRKQEGVNNNLLEKYLLIVSVFLIYFFTKPMLPDLLALLISLSPFIVLILLRRTDIKTTINLFKRIRSEEFH